jgi:histidinol-phosphatase
MSAYEELIQEVVQITENAGRIALQYFRQPILIEMKENRTPVTVADKKTEEYIRGELEKRFPEFGILGEEFGEVTKKSDLVWTIDPIDGTRSFIRGIPLFGTLVGLLHKGKPVMGVMVLPALEETYFAADGTGAFCNGHQLHVSPTATIESAFLGFGDVDAFENAGKKSTMLAIQEKAHTARSYTDCFGHSLVLRGAMDAMIDPVISLWDVAPIACLVQEAGGEWFSFDGAEDLRETSFISCTPALKQQILGLR